MSIWDEDSDFRKASLKYDVVMGSMTLEELQPIADPVAAIAVIERICRRLVRPISKPFFLDNVQAPSVWLQESNRTRATIPPHRQMNKSFCYQRDKHTPTELRWVSDRLDLLSSPRAVPKASCRIQQHRPRKHSPPENLRSGYQPKPLDSNLGCSPRTRTPRWP